MRLSLILWVFPFTLSFAQSPAIQWEKTFGGKTSDEASCIITTREGGYAVAGKTALLDHSDRIRIIKLSPDGSIQWEKLFSPDHSDEPTSILQTEDNGYIISGYRINKTWKALALKLNRDGDVEWDKCFRPDGTSINIFSHCIETRDGYLFAGETQADRFYSWILKTDKNGSMIWQKMYRESNASARAKKIIELDGNYILCGTSIQQVIMPKGQTDNDYNFWVCKISGHGEVKWGKIFGEKGKTEQAWDIALTADGGYIVTGDSDQDENPYSCRCWTLKLDESGEKEWEFFYDHPEGDDRGHSVVQSPDGGYIVTGLTPSRHGGAYDLLILKISQNCKFVWEKILGGKGWSVGNSMAITEDGGFIVAGFTEYKGEGEEDFWVIKCK